mmetsp:Transcript_80449/g.213537  ORF Transcript_80449/g.213537 Transcript_80449/m.213537 type:complete len:205 (-) Transcript_80449:362-976(-)
MPGEPVSTRPRQRWVPWHMFSSCEPTLTPVISTSQWPSSGVATGTHASGEAKRSRSKPPKTISAFLASSSTKKPNVFCRPSTPSWFSMLNCGWMESASKPRPTRPSWGLVAKVASCIVVATTMTTLAHAGSRLPALPKRSPTQSRSCTKLPSKPVESSFPLPVVQKPSEAVSRLAPSGATRPPLGSTGEPSRCTSMELCDLHAE